MSNLVSEILLRLAKAGAALVLGIVLYLVLVGPFCAASVGVARARLVGALEGGVKPAADVGRAA